MSNPVVDKLRERSADKIKTLSSGVRVIIEGVSNFEMQEVAMKAGEVYPPIYKDPETGRDVENYADPHYQRQLEKANLARGLMVLDAMLIGVILVDGLPPDDEWVKVLRFKEKRGLINLEDLDFNSPIEKEYAFKKHVAFINPEDWKLLQGKVEEIQEATSKADAMFQGDAEQSADSRPSDQEGSQG